jgi:ADP-dependent phosphofructokinase/glucokinase
MAIAQTKEIKIGMLQIRADVQPATFDQKNRTVEVIMSSGYRGQRFDYYQDGFYQEELEISPEAVRNRSA